MWEAGGESRRRRTIMSRKRGDELKCTNGYEVSSRDSRLGVNGGSINALRA